MQRTDALGRGLENRKPSSFWDMCPQHLCCSALHRPKKCRAHAKLTTHKFLRGWHPQVSTEGQPCSINCSSVRLLLPATPTDHTLKSVDSTWPRVRSKAIPAPRCYLMLGICSG